MKKFMRPYLEMEFLYKLIKKGNISIFYNYFNNLDRIRIFLYI